MLASPPNAPHGTSRLPTGHSRGHIARSPATEEAFNAVFDSSAEALVLIDSAGRVQRANSRARELLRLQSFGKHGQFLAADLPGTVSSEVSEFWSHSAGRLPRSIDTRLGGSLPLRVTLRAIVPGTQFLLLCVEEASVVQRAELRWRQLESELRGILESVQSSIALFSTSGDVRFLNARFGELLGMDLRQMRKIRSFDELSELISPRFHRPENFSAPWRSFVESGGEPGHDELEITRPARRVIERFFRPILDSEGRAIGWLGALFGCHRRAPGALQNATDRKNGGARPACLRHRARIE